MPRSSASATTSVEDLDKRLGRLPKEAGKLVVLEGVYSMLGDIAPLKEMVAVAKKHGCMVLSDEAHSMGFYGPNGRGVYEEQGCEGDVDFIVGTFSKSVGTVGGFCVSNHPKFEAIRLACRPYIFTASLPPSVVATAATSIRKLKHAHNKRQHLWENARQLHGGLTAMGFKLGTEKPDSAIIAVILDDQEQAVAMWQALLDGGLYVNMARPPGDPGRHLSAALLALRRAYHRADRRGAEDVRSGRTNHKRDQLREPPGFPRFVRFAKVHAMGGSDAEPRLVDRARAIWRGVALAVMAVLGAGILIALVILQSNANTQRDRALQLQSHSYDVMILTRTLSGTIARAEAALGRYVISGNADIGRDYADQWDQARVQIDRLDAVTADNPISRSRSTGCARRSSAAATNCR